MSVMCVCMYVSLCVSVTCVCMYVLRVMLSVLVNVSTLKTWENLLKGMQLSGWVCRSTRMLFARSSEI